MIGLMFFFGFFLNFGESTNRLDSVTFDGIPVDDDSGEMNGVGR